MSLEEAVPWRVGVALTVAELVVLAMEPRPEHRASLQCERSQRRPRAHHPLVAFERPMRKQAMKPDGYPKAGEHEEADEEDDGDARRPDEEAANARQVRHDEDAGDRPVDRFRALIVRGVAVGHRSVSRALKAALPYTPTGGPTSDGPRSMLRARDSSPPRASTLSNSTHLVSELLAQSRAPARSLDEFVAALVAAPAPPFDAAVRGGSLADRTGYAFVAGIRAAIGALIPALPRTTTFAFCVTESRGGHPRNIETRFDEATHTLDGEKHWATLAPHADGLLVLAKIGEEAGRNVLRLVRVDARGPGVVIETMPEAPFAPEVPHAIVRLTRAPALQVLEGDGFERYVKPFRTLEDVHVTAAILAYLVVEARSRSWSRDFVEDAVASIVALRGLSDSPAAEAATHIAVGGALRSARLVFERADQLFSQAPPGDDAARRWVRDRPLGDVAARVRELRLESAWRQLAGS